MNENTPQTVVAPVAWAVTLFVSLLPEILFRELTGAAPAWLFWLKLGVLGAGLVLSSRWKPLRGLRLFFAVLLTLYSLEWGVDQAYRALGYTTWLAGLSRFQRDMLAVQIPRATTGVLLVLAMLALTRSRARFFFVAGRLDAPAAPIPWILTRPPAWNRLGPAIAAAMCLGLVVFAFGFGRPPALASALTALPLLPLILIFAASNAFGEEILYRAPWLGALEGPLGPSQALLLTAAYFGIGHFYGVPYGVLGVGMAFIPGWLMGKAMLETRGFFWAWFIHLCMDTVVFFFIALGSVTPGG